MITLYGLTQCSTCKKALAWLQDHGIEHRFIDYREHPLSGEALKSYAEVLTWPRLVNRASMTWRNLPEDRKQPDSDADWLGLVAEYPALIRRPLAVAGDTVLTGFSDKRYREAFDPA